MRVVVDGASQLDAATLTDRPLVLAGSTQVKLKSTASYAIETLPSRIVRENQQYKRYIEVDYRRPHRMGNEFLNEALDAFSTPPGYRLEREQRAFFTEETERAFGWVILGTIVLVFLATAAVFESWCLPGVVLLSVPMALVGVAGAFLGVGDLAFAEGAFIGAVLLVGLVANDSILLVDRYRHLRDLRPHGGVAVYIPRYFPVLLTFSLEDTTGQAYPTPDYGEPRPKARTEDGGRRVMAPPVLFHGNSVLRNGVLSVAVPSSEDDRLQFDLYDTGDGIEYLHSIRLPVEGKDALYIPATEKDLLATVREATVTLYEVQKSN